MLSLMRQSTTHKKHFDTKMSNLLKVKIRLPVYRARTRTRTRLLSGFTIQIHVEHEPDRAKTSTAFNASSCCEI